MEKSIAWLCLTVALLMGCSRQDDSAPENEFQKFARWKKEAEVAVTNECKAVVGFQRIVKCYVSDWPEEHPQQWTAEADVDYINHVGGVDRTNLHFVFSTHGSADGRSEIICVADRFNRGTNFWRDLEKTKHPETGKFDGNWDIVYAHADGGKSSNIFIIHDTNDVISGLMRTDPGSVKAAAGTVFPISGMSDGDSAEIDFFIAQFNAGVHESAGYHARLSISGNRIEGTVEGKGPQESQSAIWNVTGARRTEPLPKLLALKFDPATGTNKKIPYEQADWMRKD